MKETKIILLETPKRVYYVTNYNGLWNAHFRPINPKTGKPWQASRHLPGADCYRTGRYGDGGKNPIEMGAAPSFEVWARRDGYQYCLTGWSTEALATAEALEHARKAGLIN